MCICYFIGLVVKIVLHLHFLHTKDGKLIFLMSLLIALI